MTYRLLGIRQGISCYRFALAWRVRNVAPSVHAPPSAPTRLFVPARKFVWPAITQPSRCRGAIVYACLVFAKVSDDVRASSHLIVSMDSVAICTRGPPKYVTARKKLYNTRERINREEISCVISFSRSTPDQCCE